MQLPIDDAGPTAERIAKACVFGPDGKVTQKFYDEIGRGRRGKHFTMLDDPLGKALMRRVLSVNEHSALRRYALHWVAGGLQGALGSVDLNRIYAFDPSAMSGLSRTERQLEHKRTYYAAQDAIGLRPSYVATQVACFGRGLQEIGETLGFKSPYRARERAGEYLSSAGAGLVSFFDKLRG